MKLQKRIMLFTAGILVLALMTLLLFNSVLFHRIWMKDGSVNKISGSEMLFSVNDAIKNFKGAETEEFVEVIEKTGCELVLCQEGALIYSNLEKGEEIPFVTSKIAEGKTSLSYGDDQGILASKVVIGDQTYEVYVIFPEGVNLTKEQQGKDKYIVEFVIIGMISVCVIFVFSMLITNRMTKQIITPITLLLSSANRIEQGDLSTNIEYEGVQEFELLCNAFNQMQYHLKKEQEKSVAYEEARTEMVAGISHDLRTPLTSIKGYVKGILDGVAATPEKQKAYLEIVYNKSNSMDQLLQKLLLFSNLETGNLPFYYVETDLGQFLNAFIQEKRQELEHRGVMLSYEIEEACYPVTLDSEQMTRVLENLVENAVKYAEVEPLKIHITGRKKHNRAEIVVKDNGQGVSEEKLAHLFEQFYRGDESRSTKGKEGNGLGLYIAKYIVEMHHGTIRADNEAGLKISIQIPLAEKGNKEIDGENISSRR